MNKRPEAKIGADHILRKAYVYVRQSSIIQVQNHQESTRRQYELQKRAIELGWSKDNVAIIDEDLGCSASKIGVQRGGFQRLLNAMVSGEVGAIFSVEVSRLARQDSEGYRLVEVAALMGVLLVDEIQVYDPNMADDRLMLGLKVLLSSNEIRMMRQRMQKNKMSKAQRGELRLELPIGFVNGEKGEVLKDPNEEVQGAVELLFERYRLNRSLSGVAQYFNENGLLFPRRKGNWGGPLEWRKLSMSRVRYVLSNPLYAGAYVYGRTAQKTVLGENGRIRQKAYKLKPQDWGAVIWDAFEGYITREEYEANCKRLEQNVMRYGQDRRRNLRKDGSALLGGIVLCGHCGKRMYVHYAGITGEQVAYFCNSDRVHYGERICQRLSGKRVDQLVAERLMDALTPAQIELSLAAVKELEQQQTALLKQWQRRLEGAQYAARRAQRRYEQVDPENRLVARSLEAQWETSLKEVARLESEVGRLCQQERMKLSKDQHQALLALAQDLPRLWKAESTTWKQRKQLLQSLVADVTLTRRGRQASAKIRWHTNQVDAFEFIVPTKPPPKSQHIIDRIAELYQSLSDQQIAQILNQEGGVSACWYPYSRGMVADVRRKNGFLRKTHSQRPTSPATLERLRELSQTHTDKVTAEILNQEGFRTAKGLVFTKARVNDTRRRYNISKMKKDGSHLLESVL